MNNTTTKRTEVTTKSNILPRGTRGTYAGFPATIIRHYAGNMYEIRVPGGVPCVDVKDFIINK